MILSHVHIRNYKQYGDEHDIPIPSAATIGVIGANGVGKTTLFEAIEWCLYSPSAIPNKDIRPRGRAGTTKVVVTLEMPSSGQQFIVERELKRSSTQAVVYRVEPDGEETILVQGSRQVTDYVAQKLIGLSHKAFIATFFTRQKELHFFGDLGDTERRREVGKLLGLETIRAAQQLIAEDRRRAGNEAQVLRTQYEHQSQGYDFPAEIAVAEATIAATSEALSTARKAVDAATATLATVEIELATQQELKDRDTACGQRMLTLQGQRQKSEQTRQHVRAELDRLAERERERTSLLPVAARIPDLRAELETQERLRTQAERKRELEQQRHAIEQRRGEHIVSLRSTVTTIVPPSPLHGWIWDDDADTPAVEVACGRLVEAISIVDVSRAQRVAADLQQVRALSVDHAEAVKTLEHYRSVRTGLEQNVADLVQGGEPADKLAELDARRQELVAGQSGINVELTQNRTKHQQVTKVLAHLREDHIEGACPTCGRPFDEDSAIVMLASMQRDLQAIQEECGRLTRRGKAIEGELDALARRRSIMEKAHTEVSNIRGRIYASGKYIDEQSTKVAGIDGRLRDAMMKLGRDQLPTDDDLMRATVELQTWQRLVDARSGIERIRESFVIMTRNLTPIDDELRKLADVAYDPDAHRRATSAYQEAATAQTTVGQIDRDLARRPQLSADLATCEQELATTTSQIADVERERVAIGFDAAKLAAATAAVQTTRAEERAALESRHVAEVSLRDAEHARESLVREQERIAGLATRADACQREQDTLDQMYREFTEFERYAAAWYAPKLSEITSELVAEVTDGKYDRVVFDNNFGIDIYDGDEEKFPLDTFSGGERDAISLCARIALSRVIGGQGATPPGFLVLDEVFGSLDRDRRTRLLEMLGAITSQGESFRQVFIISHVDDVRTAPVFDELWQVVESSEGASQLNVLAAGADIGEL